jgi:hypothetical protein
LFGSCCLCFPWIIIYEKLWSWYMCKSTYTCWWQINTSYISLKKWKKWNCLFCDIYLSHNVKRLMFFSWKHGLASIFSCVIFLDFLGHKFNAFLKKKNLPKFGKQKNLKNTRFYTWFK